MCCGATIYDTCKGYKTNEGWPSKTTGVYGTANATNGRQITRWRWQNINTTVHRSPKLKLINDQIMGSYVVPKCSIALCNFLRKGHYPIVTLSAWNNCTGFAWNYISLMTAPPLCEMHPIASLLSRAHAFSIALIFWLYRQTNLGKWYDHTILVIGKKIQILGKTNWSWSKRDSNFTRPKFYAPQLSKFCADLEKLGMC